MIEWMQKHKKWLVLTIWISTISFIAAGMVGWGSYNFSLNEGVVAQVGKINITQKQLQTRYAQLLSQYNANGVLDLQKDLGLEDLALKSLIEQALLQNFALDLGLRVTHQQVIEEIAKMEYFQKEDKFDSVLYKEVLKQNNFSPSEFENEVTNELLVKKVANLIPLNQSTALEKETFSFPALIEDKVQIKILQTAHIELTPAQIKEFWEANQSKYQTLEQYKIALIEISLDSQKPTQEELKKFYEENKSKYLDKEGNISSFASIQDQLIQELKLIQAEDQALQEYVALKKAERLAKEKILLENDENTEIVTLIQKGEIGETFKPTKTKNGFVVLKILDKIPRKNKTFQDAQEEAKADLYAQEKQKALQKQAQELIKNGFKGESLGFLGWNERITHLSLEESRALKEKIFTSTSTRGSVSFDDKIIVFEILNQKLRNTIQTLQKDREKSKEVVSFYKGQIVTKEFYKTLENKYKILTFQKKGN